MSTHTERGNVALVNQSCLTADIWLRAECDNSIPDRSKGQPTTIRERVAQGGTGTGGKGGSGLNYTYSKILNALKFKGRCKSSSLLPYPSVSIHPRASQFIPVTLSSSTASQFQFIPVPLDFSSSLCLSSSVHPASQFQLILIHPKMSY